MTRSVPTGYVDHVVFKLWQGDVCIYNVEGAHPLGKREKYLDALMPQDVKAIIEDCSLLSLVDYSLAMIDVSLLIDFFSEDIRRHIPFIFCLVR